MGDKWGLGRMRLYALMQVLQITTAISAQNSCNTGPNLLCVTKLTYPTAKAQHPISPYIISLLSHSQCMKANLLSKEIASFLWKLVLLT